MIEVILVGKNGIDANNPRTYVSQLPGERQTHDAAVRAVNAAGYKTFVSICQRIGPNLFEVETNRGQVFFVSWLTTEQARRIGAKATA